MPKYRVTKYEKTEWYTEVEAESEQDASDEAMSGSWDWFGGYILDEEIMEVELLDD